MASALVSSSEVEGTVSTELSCCLCQLLLKLIVEYLPNLCVYEGVVCFCYFFIEVFRGYNICVLKVFFQNKD